MTFSFGFSGEDIDVDESEVDDERQITLKTENAECAPELVEAKRHEIGEWVSAFILLTMTKTKDSVADSSIPNIIQQTPCCSISE